MTDPAQPGRTPPLPPDNPVLVEVWRGEFLESRHRGAVAVVDLAGDVVFAAGNIEVPVYPRSSLKPLQALALLETGAATRFGLDGSHLCLACASHNGEVEHARRVGEWLAHVGLSATDLECGAHPPYSDIARDELARAGRAPDVLQNNCSGKHAGFLTTARHLGQDHRGYVNPDHPVQRRVTDVVEEVCEYRVTDTTPGVDGCGIPVYGFPLLHLARAFARFAPGAQEADARSRARRSIVEGIVGHPYLIAGSGRFCSRVILAGGGQAIMKTGAEGVYTGTLLGEGLGIALKIDDGATRAAEVLMAAVLNRFARDADYRAVLSAEANVVLRNAAGREVGAVRAPSIATL